MIYSYNRTKLSCDQHQYQLTMMYNDIMTEDYNLLSGTNVLTEAVNFRQIKDTIVKNLKRIFDKIVDFITGIIGSIKKLAGDIKKKTKDKKYQICVNRAEKIINGYGFVIVYAKKEPIAPKRLIEEIPTVDEIYDVKGAIDKQFDIFKDCIKQYQENNNYDVAEEYSIKAKEISDKMERAFKATVESFNPSEDFFIFPPVKDKTSKIGVKVDDNWLKTFEEVLENPEMITNQITKKLDDNKKELQKISKEMENDINTIIDVCIKDNDSAQATAAINKVSGFMSKCAQMISTTSTQISQKALSGFDEWIRLSNKIITSCAINIKTGKPINADEDKFEDDLDLSSEAFKKAVKSGDLDKIRSLLMYALETNPASKNFDRMEKYARKKIGNIYEQDDGKDNDMANKTKWTWDDMEKLCSNLADNFSKERVELIRKVIIYLFKNGVEIS